VGAAAIIGIAGSLAVTPLVAGGVAQLSAGLAAMPAHVQASVPAIDAARPMEPLAEYPAPAPAESPRVDRPERVSLVTANGDRIGAQATAPRFADFDPQRFSARTATEETSPDAEDYAWISEDAAAVTLASLDQRFAAPISSAATDAIAPEPAVTDEDDSDAASVPLPAQRPRIAIASAPDDSRASAPVASATAEPRRAEPARTERGRSGAALAYANPDAAIEEDKSGGIFGRLFNRRDLSVLPGRGSKVAVYDIGAQTVYMPNGEKLEAHSGLGHMKDNPRYVAEKNKGPTPPNLYRLKMRESRFHGVEAIRLLPADGKKKFNRDGLLAHTYMYVRNGGMDKSQSNGCVVFADYDKFLKAFKRGRIEHLIVVPHLKEVPTYMAAL
jgi:hypothetical protein